MNTKLKKIGQQRKEEFNKDQIYKKIQKLQKQYCENMEAYQSIVRRYHFTDSMPEDVSQEASLLVTKAMEAKEKSTELMKELGIIVPEQKIVSNARPLSRKEVAEFFNNKITDEPV